MCEYQANLRAKVRSSDTSVSMLKLTALGVAAAAEYDRAIETTRGCCGNSIYCPSRLVGDRRPAGPVSPRLGITNG